MCAGCACSVSAEQVSTCMQGRGRPCRHRRPLRQYEGSIRGLGQTGGAQGRVKTAMCGWRTSGRGRGAHLGVGEDELADGAVVGEAVDAGADGKDEDDRRRVEAVALRGGRGKGRLEYTQKKQKQRAHQGRGGARLPGREFRVGTPWRTREIPRRQQGARAPSAVKSVEIRDQPRSGRTRAGRAPRRRGRCPAAGCS